MIVGKYGKLINFNYYNNNQIIIINIVFLNEVIIGYTLPEKSLFYHLLKDFLCSFILIDIDRPVCPMHSA